MSGPTPPPGFVEPRTDPADMAKRVMQMEPDRLDELTRRAALADAERGSTLEGERVTVSLTDGRIATGEVDVVAPYGSALVLIDVGPDAEEWAIFAADVDDLRVIDI